MLREAVRDAGAVVGICGSGVAAEAAGAEEDRAGAVACVVERGVSALRWGAAKEQV